MGEREPASRAVLNTNTVLAFLILGWGGGALGPALPWLAGHWGVRLDEAGALFTMNFLGACGTVALSGVLLDRVGRKPLLVAGALLLMMGLLGVGLAPSLPVALASALLLGLGFGCLDVTLNVFVADLYPGARDAALNLMNTAFGAGALVGPLSVGVALKLGHSPQEVLWGLSGIALLNGVIYLALRFPSTPAAVAAPTATSESLYIRPPINSTSTPGRSASAMAIGGLLVTTVACKWGGKWVATCKVVVPPSIRITWPSRNNWMAARAIEALAAGACCCRTR
jgi:MFS family permease